MCLLIRKISTIVQFSCDRSITCCINNELHHGDYRRVMSDATACIVSIFSLFFLYYRARIFSLSVQIFNTYGTTFITNTDNFLQLQLRVYNCCDLCNIKTQHRQCHCNYCYRLRRQSMHIAWQKQTLLIRSNLPTEPLVWIENKMILRAKSEIVRAHSELVLANHYELEVCVI